MGSKYETIVNTLIQKIESGQLKKGDKLPSVRQLSQTFNCSKDTAQKALLELRYKKLIYAVPKSGYYVLEGKVTHESSLRLSLTYYNRMSYEDFRLCLSESMTNRENYLFNYYPMQEGLQECRASLQHYLANQAVYTTADNIIITSGTQQALYILVQMEFPSNQSTILLEEPTYHRMIHLVKQLKQPYKTISRDFNGIDLKLLERLFAGGDIKFFYTISRFSNPLGLSYSTEERQKIIALAQRYQVYIIEDDYMGDFSKSTDLPLHYYDTNEQVIYLKSFSQSVFPALRLASLVLPKSLKSDFLNYKKLIDSDTNLIMQQAFALYLDNGMFSKNTNYLKQVFQQQMKQAEETIEQFDLFEDYNVSPHRIILQLKKEAHLGTLQFTRELNFLTDSYLGNVSKRLIRTSNDKHLHARLKRLHQFLSSQ